MLRRYYYPSSPRLLLGPLAFSTLLGLPVAKSAWGWSGGVGVFCLVFVATLLPWRWFFEAEVGGGRLQGRNPETFRWTVIELSAIRSVRKGVFELGRVPGLIVEAAPGRAVFVGELGSTDPELCAIVDALYAPD